MEEIEKAESKDGAGARPGGRKPRNTKQLRAAVARLYIVWVAKAVGDSYGMYA